MTKEEREKRVAEAAALYPLLVLERARRTRSRAAGCDPVALAALSDDEIDEALAVVEHARPRVANGVASGEPPEASS